MASENASEQGGRGLAVDSVNCTEALIVVRVPVPPALENGIRAAEVCPEASVKAVALPIVAPLALWKEILPVHDAAVPSDALLAKFATLISALSVAPSPTGGKLKSRVFVLLCATAEDTAPATANIKTRLLIDISYLSKCGLTKHSFRPITRRGAGCTRFETGRFLYVLDSCAGELLTPRKGFVKNVKHLRKLLTGSETNGILESTRKQFHHGWLAACTGLVFGLAILLLLNSVNTYRWISRAAAVDQHRSEMTHSPILVRTAVFSPPAHVRLEWSLRKALLINLVASAALLVVLTLLVLPRRF